jgi:hypothetical protein
MRTGLLSASDYDKSTYGFVDGGGFRFALALAQNSQRVQTGSLEFPN